MEKIRSTFKRSKTPTAADMKGQSSLEVPKQIRSASVDEMQLDTTRLREQHSSGKYLRVPNEVPGKGRSRSFDSNAASDETSFLDVPRKPILRRRSSSEKSTDRASNTCLHCLLKEEWEKKCSCEHITKSQRNRRLTLELLDLYSDNETGLDSSTSEEDTDIGSRMPLSLPISEAQRRRYSSSEAQERLTVRFREDRTEPLSLPCGITVTLSPNSPQSPPRRQQQESPRRFPSPGSPKLERQEALFGMDPDLPNSAEQSFDSSLSGASGSYVDDPNRSLLLGSSCETGELEEEVVEFTEIKLEVPVLPLRDRSASFDTACHAHSSQEYSLQDTTAYSCPDGNWTHSSAIRSKSVDMAFATETKEKIQQRASTGVQTSRQFLDVDRKASTDSTQTLRNTPDWTENAVNGEHLWLQSSSSADLCYVTEADCTRKGERVKCAACRVVVHTGCIGVLMDKVKFGCKPSFRDVGIRQYREQTAIHHHWAHRRTQKGKCRQCGKSFQSKLSFSSKEIVALSCSWCKHAYHNKETCFSMKQMEEACDMGFHCNIIVPPSWIVKLPRKGSFKSSLRKQSPKKKGSSKRRKEKGNDMRVFVVKPIPSPAMKPLLVFINPKSGGNQGVKLLSKFQWLLNPRQVFDLTQGGPKMGLEMFRKVANLRVLACGGDGTVGWILSVLDQIGMSPPPAVGVLPLGTGNDLARSLGWGGGYTDEPISKILQHVSEGEMIQLDRWELKMEKNPDGDPNAEEGKDTLPLNVVNNYFSLGVDAHIALEFHEAREARPDKFNSRIRNKMFYGQMGGKDLLQRKWKDLSEYVTVTCDGKDLTGKLREHKVHCIVFLNIHSYGSGTHPWNPSAGKQQTDDGLIEVLGLTTYQLPMLQAGGHGTCLTRCKSAEIVTKKTIPMQVDGEACRVKPSKISINLLNKAHMIMKRRHGKPQTQPQLEQLRIKVSKISMLDYEQHHYDKEALQKASTPLGLLVVDQDADLEQVRSNINRMQDEQGNTSALSQEWCFLDSCTAERFFRIDRAQEGLHYVTDISSEELYVLDTMVMANGLDVPTVTQSTNTIPDGDRTVEVDIDRQGGGSPSAVQSIDNSETEQVKVELEPSPEALPTTVPCPIVKDVPSEINQDHDSSVEKTEVAPEENRRDSEPIEERPEESSTISEPKHDVRPSTPEIIVSPCEDRMEVMPVPDTTPSLPTDISGLLEKNAEDVIEAAKEGDLNRLKSLAMAGYSLLSIDEFGRTALHYAARWGNRDIVRYLIASAPSQILDLSDNDKGLTALHEAASWKRRSICCMLVAAGASLTNHNLEGKTARQMALVAEDPELAAYLESQEEYQCQPLTNCIDKQ